MTLQKVVLIVICLKMVIPISSQKNKKDKRMKNFYFEQEINVPVDSIDIYKWLRELTDIEYQSFSKRSSSHGTLKRRRIWWNDKCRNCGRAFISPTLLN